MDIWTCTEGVLMLSCRCSEQSRRHQTSVEEISQSVMYTEEALSQCLSAKVSSLSDCSLQQCQLKVTPVPIKLINQLSLFLVQMYVTCGSKSPHFIFCLNCIFLLTCKIYKVYFLAVVCDILKSLYLLSVFIDCCPPPSSCCYWELGHSYFIVIVFIV